MSDGEKKFFIKSSSLQQGEKNYLRLFEYISEQPEYNEETLKEQIKKEPFIKHLASEKNQLFHHVLKSIRLYRINQKGSAYVFDKSKEIQILYERGLHELADMEAETVKNIANQNELFHSLLEVLHLQIRFAPVSEIPNDEKCKRLQKLLEEKNSCIEQIDSIRIYTQLLSEVEYYFNQSILIHDASRKYMLESFLNNPYLKNEPESICQKAKMLASFSRMICYRLLRDHEKLSLSVENTGSLFKKNEFLIREFPKLYINYYGFKARLEAINNNFGEAKLFIDKVREIKNEEFFSSPDLQNHIFSRLTVYDLMYANYSGMFHIIDSQLPEIQRKMEEEGDKIVAQERTTIHFLLFVNAFAKNEVTKALKHLNVILNSDFETSRQDLYRMAKLCYLLVHEEMNNESFLIYSYKSTQRFFKKLDHVFQYEAVFLKYFRLYAISVKRPESKSDYLFSMKKQLMEVFKDPYQRIATEYFDFIAWIDSKLNASSYEAELKLKRN
ncbi:MAG: hypothetical protein AB7O73_00185 [Bacteroidia bacterium]